MDEYYYRRRKVNIAVCPYDIFVNQVGYLPDGRKAAAMNFPCERFSVVDENGAVCFEGNARRFGIDENSGDDVFIADFTEFGKAGRYRVTSGGKTSAVFEIGGGVYDKVFDDVARMFYYQRCGCELEARCAGAYTHDLCHSAPAVLWGDEETSLDIRGGWHDAGDYGRYVTAGACAAAHLLYAYKLFAGVFDRQKLNIPESDEQNGMPDILAECGYELRWLMKMQRSDGGVYHKATTAHHAPFIMPEQDKAQMYVFPVSSMATADAAAVFALAAGIYKGFDREFSEQLTDAAKRAGAWLARNPEFIGFKNPDGNTTGSYGEFDDDSNRFWAYAELYSLTGAEPWHEKLKEALDRPFSRTALGYADVGGMGALAYLLCEKETDEELKKRLADGFIKEAERLRAVASECGYGCAMDGQSYIWGSNMILMKNGMIFAIADIISGEGRYRDNAAAQLDCLLGVNALGYSYVTGSGEFRCRFPHLRTAHADGIEECIPGMVSGGANRYPADEEAVRLIPKNTPPMKCYADDVACYSLNEITIYWNSPTVFLIAFLISPP